MDICNFAFPIYKHLTDLARGGRSIAKLPSDAKGLMAACSRLLIVKVVGLSPKELWQLENISSYRYFPDSDCRNLSV